METCRVRSVFYPAVGGLDWDTSGSGHGDAHLEGKQNTAGTSHPAMYNSCNAIELNSKSNPLSGSENGHEEVFARGAYSIMERREKGSLFIYIGSWNCHRQVPDDLLERGPLGLDHAC